MNAWLTAHPGLTWDDPVYRWIGYLPWQVLEPLSPVRSVTAACTPVAEVEILPSGLRTRIRGLQTHKQKEETAVPGSRTAVNLSGVTVDQVKRGDVISYPGTYQPSRRIDVRFRLLPRYLPNH